MVDVLKDLVCNLLEATKRLVKYRERTVRLPLADATAAMGCYFDIFISSECF